MPSFLSKLSLASLLILWSVQGNWYGGCNKIIFFSINSGVCASIKNGA
jgi:hypothetical protein